MARPRQKPKGEVLVPTDSFSKRYEGADVAFVMWRTTVREGHPVLEGVEHLFEPLVPEYEVAE